MSQPPGAITIRNSTVYLPSMHGPWYPGKVRSVVEFWRDGRLIAKIGGLLVVPSGADVERFAVALFPRLVDSEPPAPPPTPGVAG